MIKTELVDVILAKEEGITKKDAVRVLEAALEAIAAQLEKGEDVKLAGFGNFVVKVRKARSGVNPRTGEKVEVPATKAVGFKPSKTLKDRVK